MHVLPLAFSGFEDLSCFFATLVDFIPKLSFASGFMISWRIWGHGETNACEWLSSDFVQRYTYTGLVSWWKGQAKP